MRLASHKVARSASLLFTLGIFVAPVLAQTSTWNTDIGNWSTPGNWTGGVPANTSNVVIGSTNGPFANPVLDVNATINTLSLGMEASLTFGTFGLAAHSLTVNSTATLVGQTNVDEGTLTLNGASTNFNTINLTTQTITLGSHQILLGEGFLNGTGSLANAGTIQGAGNISVTLSNLGIIQATDSNNPLILSGNVNNLHVTEGLGGTIALNGGTVTGGILQGLFSSSGGTINSAQLGTTAGITSPGSAFSLASGSALGVQGKVTNAGGLNLGANVTLNGNGTGTLVNNGSAPLSITNGDTLIGMNVNNAGGMLTAGGTGLTLNGVSVNGGVLNGQFATLNGTAVNNAQLGSTLGSFALAGGSKLALQGTVSTGGAVTLGTGSTLNGGGTAALTNFLSVTGNGAALTGMTINNPGTLTGAGAGFTLNGVSVNGGILDGLFTPLNGTTIANVQLGSGANAFTLSNGSALALRGDVTVGANLTLSTGVTLNGGGQTTLFNGNNISQIIANIFQITGNGATLTGMNINNATPGGMTLNLGILDGAGAGLTLNAVSVSGGIVEGQLTTLNGTALANAQVTGLSLTSGSNLTLQGTVTQTGAFTNAGTLIINSGATLDNNTTVTGGTVFSYVQTAGHTIVDGTIGAGGPAVQLQGGVLSGTGSVNSGLVNVNGIVQPGGGGAAGTLFTTSYEQQSGAIFNELIDASGNGRLFALAGEIKLDPGALLQINLLNGFTPTDGETFDIMFASELSGTFANAPATGFEMDGFEWMIAYNSDDIVLDALSPVNGGGGGTNTPEPSTFPLLAIGITALVVYSWRKRVPSGPTDFARLVSQQLPLS